jgi:hypothetical protein
MIPGLPVFDSRKGGKTAQILRDCSQKVPLPGSVDGNIGNGPWQDMRADAAPQLADSTFAGGHPSFNQPSIARAILNADASHFFCRQQ